MNVLTLAAIILFAIAAAIGFFFKEVQLYNLLGVGFSGLACLAAAGIVNWKLGGPQQ